MLPPRFLLPQMGSLAKFHNSVQFWSLQSFFPMRNLLPYDFLIFKLPCEILIFFFFLRSKLTNPPWQEYSFSGKDPFSLFIPSSPFFPCPVGFVTFVLKQETESSFSYTISVLFLTFLKRMLFLIWLWSCFACICVASQKDIFCMMETWLGK